MEQEGKLPQQVAIMTFLAKAKKWSLPVSCLSRVRISDMGLSVLMFKENKQTNNTNNTCPTPESRAGPVCYRSV